MGICLMSMDLQTEVVFRRDMETDPSSDDYGEHNAILGASESASVRASIDSTSNKEGVTQSIHHRSGGEGRPSCVCMRRQA